MLTYIKLKHTQKLSKPDITKSSNDQQLIIPMLHSTEATLFFHKQQMSIRLHNFTPRKDTTSKPTKARSETKTYYKNAFSFSTRNRNYIQITYRGTKSRICSLKRRPEQKRKLAISQFFRDEVASDSTWREKNRYKKIQRSSLSINGTDTFDLEI